MMLPSSKTVCAMLLKINGLTALVVKAYIFDVVFEKTVSVWTHDVPSLTKYTSSQVKSMSAWCPTGASVV